MTKTVRLKNGTEEGRQLVGALQLIMGGLFDEEPMAAYELVELCKDPSHVLFGNAGAELKDRRLLEGDGSVHGSIRNIVLNSVEGEGLDLKLVSPIGGSDADAEEGGQHATP